MKKYWEMKNKANNEADIFIYSEISASKFWGDETTPKDFKDELDGLGDVGTLNIYINSPGGDVFAGNSIYNMLKRHKAQKVVYIDGLAASIASVIAMAGDKIIMPKNSMIMIHKAWAGIMGNSADMIKMADTLKQIDVSIASAYERTGLSNEKIVDLMENETWMTAEEAVEYGFADEVEDAKEFAACTSRDFLNIYKNVPENIESIVETEVGEEEKPEEKSKEDENKIKDILSVYEHKIKVNNRRSAK